MQPRLLSRSLRNLLACSLFLFSGIALHAQPLQLVDGRDFHDLATPQSVEDPSKIEVIEFFSYGCPHCFHLEPQLVEWIKTLPTDVVIRRIPVAFNPDFAALQKMYYALHALGKQEALHSKVFAAIHLEHKSLASLGGATDFAVKQGINKEQFLAAYQSFGVQSKSRRASQLTKAYRVDGVPMLAIDGRYTTSISLTGTPKKMFMVTNALIDKVRAQKNMPVPNRPSPTAPTKPATVKKK